jgi:cytosine permease
VEVIEDFRHAVAGLPDLPRPIQESLSSPPLERKGWQTTIAPQYISLFLWAVYFDQLGRSTLPIGGLGWSALGSVAAGLLCYSLLYYVPAMWGQKTGRPLIVLGTSTFGTTGSIWLLGVLVGLSQIVWLAVSTYYAVDWSLRGFVAAGLLDVRATHPLRVDGVPLRGTLFLITSLLWMISAVLVGHYLVRIIAALMMVYPVFPALMLGIAAALTMKDAAGFQPLAIDPATSQPIINGGPRAFLMMIQLIFGFFAAAGVMAADSGAVTRSPADVRIGGFVGVAFASWTIATLALLTVAGAFGHYRMPMGAPHPPALADFRFGSALVLGLPARLASATFLIFGLSSLAPTCYAAFVLGERLANVWPARSRLQWTLLGTAAAWPLCATGWAGQLETVFALLGALFAPMAGAMAADYVRNRGSWPGPRKGVSVPGIVAWVFGVAIGMIPLIGNAWGMAAWARFQPAALYAFLAAFLVYRLLAAFGAEPEAFSRHEAESRRPNTTAAQSDDAITSLSPQA